MSVVRHRVPMVRQQMNPICWVACAMMLTQFKQRRSLNIDGLGYGGDPRNASVANVTTLGIANATLRSWGFKVKHIHQVPMPFSRSDSEAHFARRQARRASRTSLNIRRRSNPSPSQPGPSPSRPTVSETLIYMLNTWGPVILSHHCGAFSYGPSTTTPTSGLHAVLITGVDTERGRGVFYFNNPWGQTDVMTSISSIEGAANRWENARHAPPFAYLS
jgi:hypothetical protein